MTARASLSRLFRRLRTDGPGQGSWVAMVDQHHRMVRAMVLATPVHPPLADSDPASPVTDRH